MSNNDFNELIKDLETSAKVNEQDNIPFIISASKQDSALSKFIGAESKQPTINTNIPTRKELKEREIAKKENQEIIEQLDEGEFLEADNGKEEVFFTIKNTKQEKVIFVNREKDNQGNVKKDLAIYNIDIEFIKEVRKGVTDRIPEVFKTFTPFKHDAKKTAIIKRQIELLIKSMNNMKVPPSKANIDAIADEIMGLGPLSLLTSLPDVTEIMVVDYDKIYVEIEGILRRCENVKFKNREHLSSVIERMVGLMGESINLENPILDMRLSDGSRVNIVGPPITEHNHLFLLTIRRFRDTRFTLYDLLNRNTISAEMMQYLSNVMRGRANVLLCGGTGSGKTATLEALIMEKDPNECVITVEDTRELMLKRQNWRPMKSKKGGSDDPTKDIDIRKLVKSALRMRPDSIIVGETRDATAYDILFAMNSGHDGCCTTVHANNSIQALSKFEMLAKLAKDEAPPTDALREIIVECFDVVINVGRTPDGQRKMMSVDEVTGYNEKRHKYEVTNVFKCVQVNSDPNEPSEFVHVKNPKYFTSEKLAFKLNRWELPYVSPPDGNYGFSGVKEYEGEGQGTGTTQNITYITGENMQPPNIISPIIPSNLSMPLTSGQEILSKEDGENKNTVSEHPENSLPTQPNYSNMPIAVPIIMPQNYVNGTTVNGGSYEKNTIPNTTENNINKEPPLDELNDWEKIAKNAERERMAKKQEEDLQKIRALKKAQKEANKIKKIKERERIRLEKIHSREILLEEERLRIKEIKELAKENRYLKITEEKKQRQEKAIQEQHRKKMVKEMEKEAIRRQKNIIREEGEASYKKVWDETYKNMLDSGFEPEIAQKSADIAAKAEKDKMENKIKMLDPWKRKNIGKAENYYRMLNELGMTPEQVAEQENVSVNNILKYIKIVDENFVKQYRKFLKRTLNRQYEPLPDSKEDNILSDEPILLGPAPFAKITVKDSNKKNAVEELEKDKKETAPVLKNDIVYSINKGSIEITKEDLKDIF